MKRLPRLLLTSCAATVIVAGAAAPALAQKCLESPFTAFDADQVARVRETIDAFCECEAFDGSSPATKHGRYVRCAARIAVAKAKAGKLRNQCKGFIRRIYARSTCGFTETPKGDRLPCVKKMLSDGKVTCAIKPEETCTGKPGVFTRVPCSDTFTCADSADSNGNFILDPGDSGSCVETLGPVVGSTQDIPSGAHPAETPGTAGVTVMHTNMITQFGGADFSLNNARFTRYRYARRSGEPDAILVLVPGFAGGASGFKILAENLIERARTDEDVMLEVWAIDRRTNQLEDLVGLDIAEKLEDPMAALDWMYGFELGFTTLSKALRTGPGAPKRRAIFYGANTDTAFMANWTNLVFSRDIDAVIEHARDRATGQNVFLGGHSAGTGFMARYASTDFNLTGIGPAEPGFAKVRGLVLFDGGGGSTAGAGALTADTLDRIEAKANGGLYGAVRTNQPRCADGLTACTIATEAADCAAFTPPKCTLPTTSYTTGLGVLALGPRLLGSVEVAGIQAINDLDGSQMLIQADFAGPGTSAIDLVADLGILGVLPEANVAAGIGNFLDDDGLAVAFGAFFVATSLGAPGPVVAGLATWFDYDDSASFPPSVIPDNGPPPAALPAGVWGQEKEVTRMDRLAAALATGGTNFTDWYYPNAGPSTTSVAGVCDGGTCTVGNVGAPCANNGQCNQAVNLDSTQLSVGRGRRDIENLTQAANIDVPVIAFGGSNGLTPVPGNYVAFANSIGTCAAPSCDGVTPRVVDDSTPNPAFPTLGDVSGGFEVHIAEGYAHVDVLTAEDDASNNIIGPLGAFIARNLLP
jgi:pimeloyl-ACP methyl ester carboxylesterase